MRMYGEGWYGEIDGWQGVHSDIKLRRWARVKAAWRIITTGRIRVAFTFHNEVIEAANGTHVIATTIQHSMLTIGGDE